MLANMEELVRIRFAGDMQCIVTDHIADARRLMLHFLARRIIFAHESLEGYYYFFIPEHIDLDSIRSKLLNIRFSIE